jgi:hypothetical protein
MYSATRVARGQIRFLFLRRSSAHNTSSGSEYFFLATDVPPQKPFVDFLPVWNRLFFGPPGQSSGTYSNPTELAVSAILLLECRVAMQFGSIK